MMPPTHLSTPAVLTFWKELKKSATSVVGDHETIALRADGSVRFRGTDYPSLTALPKEGQDVVVESMLRAKEFWR